MTKLTVAIPNYNGGNNLKRAIESCRNIKSSKKNYEILHVRYESINLYVACTTLLTFGIKNIRNPCLSNSTKTQ